MLEEIYSIEEGLKGDEEGSKGGEDLLNGLINDLVGRRFEWHIGWSVGVQS